MRRTTTAFASFALLLISAVAGLLGARMLWQEPTDRPAAAQVDSPAPSEPSQPTADPTTEFRLPPLADTYDEPTQPAGPSDAEIAAAFVTSFNAAHANADLGHLLGSIHPSVPHAFGAASCRTYIEATAGSIWDMAVVSVSDRTEYSLASPDGPVVFPDALPVSATWTIAHTGEEQSIVFHLAPIAGTSELGWLTQCGITVQST
jgi:hypothetical protein